MDMIRKICPRSGSLVVALPPAAARTCCTGCAPCVTIQQAHAALLIRAYEPGLEHAGRMSVRMVRSYRGAYFVTIPVWLARVLGLKAGQFLEFAVDGDQIRARRTDTGLGPRPVGVC
ncbi:MAG: AbrB/MazE/SpoVT family DNA-binding domain-containing protein [Alphaproteobacteria bacterium]|nr:AbrB/MazE/SpoVT family DNA-binding domain-containing protein [Alphaproteobacteria bacterium]MDA7989675.1 AbrB/MazE/SpoVT family DNA-binding domain-containing protein [Gammaproteobacteria bacterium]